MKVYEFRYESGKYEWYCGATLVDVLHLISLLRGTIGFEYEGLDDIVRVQQSDWADIRITDELGDNTTIEDFMRDQAHPSLIFSTQHLSHGDHTS